MIREADLDGDGMVNYEGTTDASQQQKPLLHFVVRQCVSKGDTGIHFMAKKVVSGCKI
jgi:hypothetical protein